MGVEEKKNKKSERKIQTRLVIRFGECDSALIVTFTINLQKGFSTTTSSVYQAQNGLQTVTTTTTTTTTTTIITTDTIKAGTTTITTSRGIN